MPIPIIYNVRSVRARWTSSIVAVLGIALAGTFEARLSTRLSAEKATAATLASVQRNRAQIVVGRVPDDVTDGHQRALLQHEISLAYTDGFRAVMLISAGLCWLAAGLALFALPATGRGGRRAARSQQA